MTYSTAAECWRQIGESSLTELRQELVRKAIIKASRPVKTKNNVSASIRAHPC